MNRGIFGGGVFSVARGNHLRRVGDGKRVLAEVGIRSLRGAVRDKSGKIRYQSHPPYLPTTLRQDLHPGGNSLCFTIQIAALMGCNPIYAVGFTLQSGLGYFHGRTNPVTKRTTIYEAERALAWCQWFEKMWPGRVQLDPSFDGPIYQVFKRAQFDARQTTPGQLPADDRGHESDANGEDAGEER